MRIAQVVGPKVPFSPNLPDTPYSIPAVSYLITEELVARGHEVTVFAPSDSVTTGKIAKGTISSVWARRHHLFVPGKKASKLEKEVLHFHFKNVILSSKNFDIIHNHELGFLFFAPMTTIPVVTTLHYHVAKIRNKWLLHEKNNQFIAISKKQTINFPRLPFAGVIHHGIDPTRFNFNPKPQDFLGWLGRITAIKGCLEAVRAAIRSKTKLFIAGNIEKDDISQEYTKKIKELVRKNKNISFLGTVEKQKKAFLLENSRAILMPIRWEEPFGLVAIESLACGTPVIAFNRGALPEIIKDGKTGFIVRNVSEMVRAILKIETLKRRDCREAVEKYFNIKRVVDEHEKLYEKVIKSSKKHL